MSVSVTPRGHNDNDYNILLDQVLPTLPWYTVERSSIVKDTLVCKDKRQNGTCGCVQRYITARGDMINRPDSFGSPESKLKYIADLSFESHRLKTERNPIAGRRYSDSFANHVNEHRSDLSRHKLCKKAIAAVLHCSLNFLYRDNNNKQKVVKKIEQIRATPCCEKQCLQILCTKFPQNVCQWRHRLEQKDAKSEENRKVFFELRAHQAAPCTRAIGEITSLSKATLNNLSSKTPETGIKHKLHGRRRQHSGHGRMIRSSNSSSQSSMTSSVSSISPSITSPLQDVKPFPGQLSLLPADPHRISVIRQNAGVPDIKVELIETFKTENDLPVIHNEEISRVTGPMRPRLNAERSDQERLPTEAPEIPTLLTTYNEVMDSRTPSVHDLPTGISPTIRPNSSTPPVETERRKRKKMPGLIRLSPTEPGPESPPLRMPIEFPLEKSPENPAKKPARQLCMMQSILNTPTITPNTPSNPKPSKQTPVRSRADQIFFSEEIGSVHN